MDPDAFGLMRARELEQAIDQLGENRVAAFIAEPIQGAGGVIIPPPWVCATAPSAPAAVRMIAKADVWRGLMGLLPIFDSGSGDRCGHRRGCNTRLYVLSLKFSRSSRVEAVSSLIWPSGSKYYNRSNIDDKQLRAGA